MKIGSGIDITEVCKNIKTVLKIIDLIFYESGNHLVIIATKLGKDDLDLPHKNGRAIDVEKPTKEGFDTYWKLKNSLGINYLVLDKKSHLHIEFAPLGETTKRDKNQRYTKSNWRRLIHETTVRNEEAKP